MTPNLDISRLVYYYTVHSVPDRPLGLKHMFYQSLTGDYSSAGLTIANHLIESKQLDHPLDLLRDHWLNFSPDLNPLVSLSLRLTVCDVVKPIEYQLFHPLSVYVAGSRYHAFKLQFDEYLELRASHKVYSDIPICFDHDRCWKPDLTREQVDFLKSTQLDVLNGHLTGHYYPEVAMFAK